MPQELRTHVINLKSLDQDIPDPIIAGGGDVNGRTLRVILTQEAWAQMTSSTKIYLKWRHKQLDIRGYNVLRQVSEEPCVWEINWPSAMLRKGDVLACLELVDKVSISPTVNFIIHVLEDPIGNSGFKNEDDWSEFQKAVLRLYNLEEKIKRIESLEMGETTRDYVSDYTIGDIQKGDVIPRGRTFDQFVRHLVTDYQSLRYVMPTTSLYITNNDYNISSGSLGNIRVSLIFDQYDAGPIKSVKFICKSDESLQIGHTSLDFTNPGGPSDNIFPTTISLIVPDRVFEIYAQVEYEDGFVKIDKFGDPIPGEIDAGTIDTNTIKLSAKKYDIYYHSTSDTIPPDLSKNFPDMNRLSKADAKVIPGDSFNISVMDGGNLVLYIPRDALSKPETKKIQSWEYSMSGPGGMTWRDMGEVTDPVPDPITDPLGYYRYQVQVPKNYEYSPMVRVNL